ncbi:uncharacterized protein LOC141544306 isoform X2 [Sminthopsis crassicaudata]|uniref:uncharacterized protein LOC141544306 isoform X2 n=1 Tax=Sminthopsis crassicaudata TaxID=9301 RepID=UPI003D697FB3
MGMTPEGETQNEDNLQTTQTKILLGADAQLLALQMSAREGLEHANRTKEKISKLNQVIRKQWNDIELVKSRCWELQDSINTTKRLERISLNVTWSKLSELENDLEKAKEDAFRHLRRFQLSANQKTTYEKTRENHCSFSTCASFPDANPYAEALAALEAMAVAEPENSPETKDDIIASSKSEDSVKDLAGSETYTSDFEAGGTEKSQEEESVSTSLEQSEYSVDSAFGRTETSRNDSGSRTSDSSSKCSESSENESESEVSENSSEVKLSDHDLDVIASENQSPSEVRIMGNNLGSKSSKDSPEIKCPQSLPGIKSIKGNSMNSNGNTWRFKSNKISPSAKISKNDSGLKNKNGCPGNGFSENSLGTKIRRSPSGIKVNENLSEVKQSDSPLVKINGIPSKTKVSESLLEAKSSGSDLGVKISKDCSGVKSSKSPPGAKCGKVKVGGSSSGLKHSGSSPETKQNGSVSGSKQNESPSGVTKTGNPLTVKAGGGPMRSKYRENVSRTRENGYSLGGRQSERVSGVKQRERVSGVKRNEGSSVSKRRERPSRARVNGGSLGGKTNKKPSGAKRCKTPPGARSQDSSSEGKSGGSLSDAVSGNDSDGKRSSSSSLEENTTTKTNKNGAMSPSVQKTHSK